MKAESLELADRGGQIAECCKLVDRIENSILTKKLFRPRQAILVAVSGGVDSMVLLALMHRLSARHHWRLSVAHFNHCLRGRSSDADQRLVQSQAKQLKLDCQVQRAHVRKFARSNGLSIEMAARRLRHRFLAEAARRKGISTVALAHHADDQVESFFVQLLRGAGEAGLGGMKWRNSSPSDPKIQLARPLLACTKAELLEFAHAENIPFREDASNAALDILRNRIRHDLLPRLKQDYQPALAKTTVRTMEILQANSEFVTQCAGEWLKKQRPAFEDLSLALQRRVLQLQLHQRGWAADFDRVERLRTAANTPVALSPRLAVYRDSSGLLTSATRSLAEFSPNRMILDLKSTRKSVRFDGLQLDWQIHQVPKIRLRGKAPAGCEYFDAEKVGPSVILRHWLPGDRFQPIGMKASVKLQDLFSNQKVPRALRHQLAVATTADNRLFWVEGLRISDAFKLDERTARTLKWIWQRG